MRIIRAQINWPRTEYSSRILLKDFFNKIGRLLPAAFEAASVRYRRNLAVAARSGDRPLTIRFADLHHRAMQTGGLVSWRSTPWQAA